MTEELPARWLEVEGELDRALATTLTVAFLGSASAGKDAAIRALFGVDFGEVDPIPGSTERVRVAALDREQRFVVVNAPGFGDIRAEVDQVGRRVLEHLDLVVYLVNAAGGATIDEKRDLAQIRARAEGKGPTLVVINKIDLIRPDQREDFVRATCAQLEVDPKDAVACAFDPLPQISEHPIGLGEVIDRIEEALAKQGKELLFAKQLRDKRAACRPLIKAAAKKAAMAGAVPVPGADITAVTWIQVRMVQEIATVHGQRLDREVVLWMVGELLAGTTKGFIKWALGALKAVGWVPGAHLTQAATSTLGSAIAWGATQAIGEAAIRWVQSEERLTIEELRQVFDEVAMKAAREKLGE